MKTITCEELLKFDPYRFDHSDKKAFVDLMARRQERWNAFDILSLEEIPSEDRLWIVLREELIDEEILHEFGCRCAERALMRIKNPDQRSVKAIEAKRRWLKGEIDDDALMRADIESARALNTAFEILMADPLSDTSRCIQYDPSAAIRASRLNISFHAAKAANGASAPVVRDVVYLTAQSAVFAAGAANAWFDAENVGREGERKWQINELKNMLNGSCINDGLISRKTLLEALGSSGFDLDQKPKIGVPGEDSCLSLKETIETIPFLDINLLTYEK